VAAGILVSFLKEAPRKGRQAAGWGGESDLHLPLPLLQYTKHFIPTGALPAQ
jgi:hypothetical protein